MSASAYLQKQLAEQSERGLRRQLRLTAPIDARRALVNGRVVLQFSSNDYLGIAQHPALAKAAVETIREAGFGSGSSRLVTGNQKAHCHLEQDIARFHGQEAAIGFGSGYLANVGALPAIAGHGDLILSDQLNHASIIDGCRLSRAQRLIFRHGDVSHLRSLLAAHRGDVGQTWIVTESVFSMDGDRAPLAQLREVADDYQASLYVDEAHAVGALGSGGRGLCAAAGVVPDILVGTFSKAFGAYGAYIVGRRPVVDFLLQRARSVVFSTGLPPSICAAARTGLLLVQSPEGTSRRERLAERIQFLATELAARGWLASGAGHSPVFPLIVGESHAAMQLCERLLDKGLFAQGIRPPTVPNGTSRLRVSVLAAHEPEDLGRLLEALDESGYRPPG